MTRFLEAAMKLFASKNPLIRYFTAVYPGVGTVLLTFLKDPIQKSTLRFFYYWHDVFLSPKSPNDTIDWIVIIFYILVILWVLFYGLYIAIDIRTAQAKSVKNEHHLDQIKVELNNAIHNAPNPNIFYQHQSFFNTLLPVIYFTNEKIKNGAADEKVYQSFFNILLNMICAFTKDYRNTQNIYYGANIMRYIPNSEDTLQIIESWNKNTNSWPYFKEFAMVYVRGILVGLPTLRYVDVPELEPMMIAIPLIRTWDGKNSILPGAATAAIDGEATIADTKAISLSQFAEIGSNQQKEMAIFFKDSYINSIASFAIPFNMKEESNPNSLDCLGVINIDCSAKFGIGEETRYYATFSALIKPILALSAPILSSYFEFLDNKK